MATETLSNPIVSLDVSDLFVWDPDNPDLPRADQQDEVSRCFVWDPDKP